MRDDFDIDSLHPIKVALAAEQVKKRKLPPSMDAKVASPNFKRFVAKYEMLNAYELEAIDPEDLQAILRKAIESVLDVDAFNHEVDQEAQDAAQIEAVRRTVLHAIKTLDGLDSEADEQ